MPDVTVPAGGPGAPPPRMTVTRDSVPSAWPRSASPATDVGKPVPARTMRYRTLRLLGEGGMVAVYEAEQDVPHRTVALKLIRAGYTSADVLGRFEN